MIRYTSLHTRIKAVQDCGETDLVHNINEWRSTLSIFEIQNRVLNRRLDWSLDSCQMVEWIGANSVERAGLSLILGRYHETLKDFGQQNDRNSLFS